MIEYPQQEKVRAIAEETLNVIIDQMKGIVKVFEVLKNADVPVIFHNGFLDIILIYKQVGELFFVLFFFFVLSDF